MSVESVPQLVVDVSVSAVSLSIVDARTTIGLSARDAVDGVADGEIATVGGAAPADLADDGWPSPSGAPATERPADDAPPAVGVVQPRSSSSVFGVGEWAEGEAGAGGGGDSERGGRAGWASTSSSVEGDLSLRRVAVSSHSPGDESSSRLLAGAETRSGRPEGIPWQSSLSVSLWWRTWGLAAALEGE